MRIFLHDKAKLIASHIQGKHIVDLGSEDGTGDNTLHKLIESYSQKKIVAVDYLGSPDIVMDLNEDFLFHPGCFDTVIASEIIEHLENPLHFLQQIKKILKKDGRLILTTPNAVSLAEVQSLFFKEGKIDYDEHLYNWHKRNMKFILQKAGFTNIKVSYMNCFWRRNILARIITNIFPFWKSNLFVVAEK